MPVNYACNSSTSMRLAIIVSYNDSRACSQGHTVRLRVGGVTAQVSVKVRWTGFWLSERIGFGYGVSASGSISSRNASAKICRRLGSGSVSIPRLRSLGLGRSVGVLVVAPIA